MIPRTLAQNCGTNLIRALTKLRAKHSEKGGSTFGIDGNKGARPGHILGLIDWSLSPAWTMQFQKAKGFLQSSPRQYRQDQTGTIPLMGM